MSKTEQVQACLRTDTGLVRDHNEDFVYAREPESLDEAEANGWLYIVADGVGGADAGEVASEYASQQMIHHYLKNNQESDLGRRLIRAMQSANTDLRQFVAERNDNSRMATTMVATIIHGSQAYIGNVGDSRAYHWRNGRIRQITKDQSLVAKLVEEGAITEEEARVHPRSNVILYSLGSERTPKIDLFHRALNAGDCLLLCSDGLTRHVDDTEISQIISEKSLEAATEHLIHLANERGGQDNISVAIIQYGQKITSQQRPSTAATRPTPNLNTTSNWPLVASAGDTASLNSILWLYTVALALFMSFLIFIVWLILRV